MTRKDFIFIADVIRSMPAQGRENAAHAFADRLVETNSNFNRLLFVQAALGLVPLTARKPLGGAA